MEQRGVKTKIHELHQTPRFGVTLRVLKRPSYLNFSIRILRQANACFSSIPFVFELFRKLKYEFHPILTTLTNNKRYCSGTSLKFASCTNGQIIQLVASACQ